MASIALVDVHPPLFALPQAFTTLADYSIVGGDTPPRSLSFTISLVKALMANVEKSLILPQHKLIRRSKPQPRQHVAPRRSEEHLSSQNIVPSSSDFLQAVISKTPVILFAINPHGIITFSEGQGLQELGVQQGSSVGASIFELYGDIPEVFSSICRALDGETITATSHIKDRVYETHYIPQFDSSGQVTGIIGIANDITKRTRAEEALSASERKFRALIEQGTDLVFILDSEGFYKYVSPSHQWLLGYRSEDLIGKNSLKFIHPEERKQLLIACQPAFDGSGASARVQYRIRHVDGSWIPIEAVGRNCLDDPEIQGFVISARDISERIMMEQQLRYLALHDAVTDLPNRAFLIEQVELALSKTPGVTLLILNLNRFKDINDTFGHHQGDLLLRAVGERLKQVYPGAIVIARLGGDEFTIGLPGACQEQVDQAVSALHAAMEEPFFIGEHPVQLDFSIGGVFGPEHGSGTAILLRKADIAMHKAKQEHLKYALYDTSYEQNTARRLDLIRELRSAIARDEFKLYYQPKVVIKTGRVYGVEALIRWQHPVHGFIPPDQFIPLAEQTGLIVPLTRWVLRAALQQCREWMRQGINLQVAVNLSMWDLRDPSLVSSICDLLKRCDVSADRLRVELTESAAMVDPDHTLAILKQLAEVGISSSIDDFGTGYSSLAYLKRLVANELKIDRSFVQHITEEAADATIVGSTVQMAHSLGLKVVAEGIEDEASVQLLKKLECDIAQGYYFARPLAPQELERWLKKQSIPALTNSK